MMEANFETVEGKTETSQCKDSKYVIYLFSNKKHATSPDRNSDENYKTSSLNDETKSDYDQPSVCLSLLESNLGAEQETVVRCHLLKILSSREDLTFENEGKYSVLQFSDHSNESFGCYYHRVSKRADTRNGEMSDDKEVYKVHTFFICLIGPANGVMESYCSELGKFCFSLVPLLDPEGLKNVDDELSLKLKSWYFHCIEYIGRCVEFFQDNLKILLHCSLWGNVEVICEDESLKWDIERFIETCSLLPKNSDGSIDNPLTNEINVSIVLTISNGEVTSNISKDKTNYCVIWSDGLNKCDPKDNIALHNYLEEFRLKTIQDLNTLKRFLKKAQTDHYSLYKAYVFLTSTSYEDILLYHAKREACMTEEKELLDIISCLQTFFNG